MKFFTTKEAADKLHISIGTLRNRLSKGDPMPPSVKIGRRRLWPSEEFDRWIMSKLVSNDEMDEFDV